MEFCKSEDIKKLPCALTQEPEEKRLGYWGCGNGNGNCGNIEQGGVWPRLPWQLGGGQAYFYYSTRQISLACKPGRLRVVRAVFQVLRTTNNLTGALRADYSVGTVAKKVVASAKYIRRCEVRVPAGATAEEALKAQEGACTVCTGPKVGSECPATVGKWYVDYDEVLYEGCEAVLRLRDSMPYAPAQIAWLVNPGSTVLMAAVDLQHV